MRFFLRVISFFRQDWHLIGLFLLMIALSLCVGLMQAWPMAVFADIVLTHNPVAQPSFFERIFLYFLPRSPLGKVIGVAVIGMLLKIAQDSIGAIKLLVNNRFTFNGRHRVRMQLFNKLQHLSIAYHRALPQGDAIYRVLTDSIGCDQIVNVVINSCVAAATLLVMAGIMLTRNVPLTIYALSVAPALYISTSYFGRRIKRESIQMKQADTRLTTLVQRAMSSVGLVQAFNHQRSEHRHFRLASDESVHSTYELEKEKALAGFAINTIYTLGGCVIFGYGGYLVYRDQFLNPVANGVTLGDLWVFMAYLGSLWDPLRTLTSAKADIQTGVAGAERVFQVLDTETTIKSPPHPISLPRRARELSLENVYFSYLPDKPVLSGVSARIAPGQMVGFVGPSGAGKSTLLQLIPRFYDVDSGSVALDGIDVRKLSVAELRRHIALVSQDNLLLPTTVAENIAYGRPHAGMSDIKRAATLAGADEFIAKLPRGYATPITEGGQNLSGGQRQRVAIARAILSDAPVMLLDEPTSALDPHNTQQIMETLNKLRRHRTIILVTHHVASVAGCDQIFVMDAGKIVERGKHEELLALDGLYSNLLHAEPNVEEMEHPIAAA